MGRSSTRAWARALLTAAATVLAVTVAVTPALADDQDTPPVDDGIGLWVPVLPPRPAAPVPPGGGAGSAGGGGSPVSADPVVAAPVVEPASGDLVVAGGLSVSDISGSSRPTLSPFEGKTELWITLRNLSHDTIDVVADFSLATFYGTRVDGTQVAVSGLKPDEVRVVGTTLQGSGQWPFVIGRVTVTPPDLIGGQQTASVSRATVVYVFPWLALIALVLVALAVFLLQLTSRVVGTAPVPASSAA